MMDNSLDHLSAKSRGHKLGPMFAQDDHIKRFKLDVNQNEIDKIWSQVRAAKLPKQVPISNPTSELTMQWLEELREYWLEKYDWKNIQEKLNSYPQYKAQIDDYKIHFYYVKGEGSNPLPLLLTHSSQGSAVEFFDCIDLLTRPSQHGGKADQAFTLIIPSLPGFGFSSMPKKLMDSKEASEIFHQLVTEFIGHDQYVTQGGDFGGNMAVQIAHLYPESVKAIHLNYPMSFNGTSSDLSEVEKNWLNECERSFERDDFDCLRMKVHKPTVLGVALSNNPMGTAAWLADKFISSTDHGGKLESVMSKETLLTNIMIYLLSEGGIAASFWYNKDYEAEMECTKDGSYLKTPTAIANYPKECILGRPPLESVRRSYNVYHYAEVPRGGHFPAMEQPELFSADLREAFKSFHS